MKSVPNYRIERYSGLLKLGRKATNELGIYNEIEISGVCDISLTPKERAIRLIAVPCPSGSCLTIRIFQMALISRRLPILNRLPHMSMLFHDIRSKRGGSNCIGIQVRKQKYSGKYRIRIGTGHGEPRLPKSWH